MRGFEQISTYKEEIKLPKRGSDKSAGYDFFLMDEVKIPAGETVKIKMGVKAYMNDDEFLGLYVRSSVGIKGLFMKNTIGIVDSDYYNNPKNEGEIMAFMENTSDEDFVFEKGERLIQGIFQKYYVANDDDANAKRSGGFGSTNK